LFSRSTPTLTTTASFRSGSTAIVGHAIPEDTAVLSHGNKPTDGIQFKLYAPNGAVVYSQWVNVHGNGTYHTSSAVVAQQTGKYTWHATYYGDNRNNTVNDQGGTAESLVVLAAPPPVTPPPPVTSPPPVTTPPPASTKPIGYETFYGTTSGDPNGALKSTEAYYRYDWSQIEPAPGVYNFSALDADFAAAEAAGQKYNFRIMPFEDGNAGPIGLKSLPGFSFHFGGVVTWQPNLDAPAVQADLDKLLAALGARYGAHTGSVDVGWFGPYGEWSNYNEDAPPPLPTLATWNWLIAATKKYFPNSAVVAQADVSYEYGNPAYLQSAMAAGAWQRFDSWGKSDSWDAQANASALATMQASPYWTSIRTIGEPWDVNTWSAADWQSAVAFAESARMALFSTKGVAVPAAELPLVEQLIAFEKTL
jgi:hypothetical protein